MLKVMGQRQFALQQPNASGAGIAGAPLLIIDVDATKHDGVRRSKLPT